MIIFVSSKRGRLEERNFAVILICIPFTTYGETNRISGSQFNEWLFVPELYPLFTAFLSAESYYH